MPFNLKDLEVTRDSLSRTFSKSPRIFVGETSKRLSAKRPKCVGVTSAPLGEHQMWLQKKMIEYEPILHKYNK